MMIRLYILLGFMTKMTVKLVFTQPRILEPINPSFQVIQISVESASPMEKSYNATYEDDTYKNWF